MSLKINFNEIKKLLPQAYPFILVDRIEEYEENNSIICLKNVSGNEWMTPGHFPDQAIFPGVLIIEGIAQAGILLFQLSRGQVHTQDEANNNHKSTFLLSSVKAKFIKQVNPGDQLFYHCSVVKMTSNAVMMEGIAKINDSEIAAKAELIFCVT